MVAITILGFVLVGISHLTSSSGRSIFISTAKLQINNDIRTFTQTLATEARSANTFILYKSSNATDYSDISKRLRDGESGDFLALLFLNPHPTPSSNRHITRVTCYFRKVSEGEEGPVLRLDYTLPTPLDPSLVAAESVIATAMNSTQPTQMVNLAKGLSSNHIFFNERGQTVIVNGQIVHGNAARRVTDTYNFAVSPRG